MTLGRYLRQKRSSRGLTLELLAARCRSLAPRAVGLTKANLGHWERERHGRAPSLGQFEIVAEALGMSFEERLHALRLARELTDREPALVA